MDVGVRRWCLPNSWKLGTRRGTPGLGVPGQIVVAFVAELRL